MKKRTGRPNAWGSNKKGKNMFISGAFLDAVEKLLRELKEKHMLNKTKGDK